MFVDTHTHLFLKEFENDINMVIDRSMTSNVRKFILPNIDFSTIEPLKNLCKNYPESCFAAIGLHPTSVKHNYYEELNKIYNELHNSEIKYYAIGEIGLDLYWTLDNFDEQMKCFSNQLEWARELNIPVIIHSRNAINEIIQIIKSFNNIKGVFHSFTGNIEQARQIIDMGFYIGINGIITYNNSGIQEIVKNIDINKILLETDSPYLSPVPLKKQRNESKNITIIAKKISEIKNINIADIEQITTQNAFDLFGI